MHTPQTMTEAMGDAKVVLTNFNNLTVDDAATIAVNGLTTDCRAVSRSQEDHTGGNLGGLSRSAHWRGELLLRLLVHGGRNQRRPDGARGHGIDTDALGDKLVAQATSEGDNGTLGRGVI